MPLYKVGTEEATKEEVEAELAVIEAAESLAAREATQAEVQADIDADEKLTAAGVVAQADDLDEQWVEIQVPEDATDGPKFWAGVHGQIVEQYGGQAVDARTVRVRKDRGKSHLATISALLPDPV